MTLKLSYWSIFENCQNYVYIRDELANISVCLLLTGNFLLLFIGIDICCFNQFVNQMPEQQY